MKEVATWHHERVFKGLLGKYPGHVWGICRVDYYVTL